MREEIWLACWGGNAICYYLFKEVLKQEESFRIERKMNPRMNKTIYLS